MTAGPGGLLHPPHANILIEVRERERKTLLLHVGSLHFSRRER